MGIGNGLNHRTLFQAASGGRLLFHVLVVFCFAATAFAHQPLSMESEQRVANQPTNVVFFVADDLGWSDLSCFGSSFYETPNLDGLAKQGVRLTNAYAACPVCSPSRASILTGLWPQRTGITDFIGAAQPADWKRNTQLLPAPYATRLEHSFLTLAEILKQRGFKTFFAGKWHLGNEGHYPEDQGFDINRGGCERGGPYGGNKYFSPYGNPRLTDGPPGEHLPDRLASEANLFMEQNQNSPFFVYFPLYSVHTPLMARPDLKTKYEKKAKDLELQEAWGKEGNRKVRNVQSHAIYAGMVHAMDEAVGKVLLKLDALGLTDNTLVIFTSDNGGLSTSEGHPTSNLPLRAGKGWLYEGGIRVPAIVRLPGRILPNQINDTPLSGPDWLPTVLASIDTTSDSPGQENWKTIQTDGVNLLPTISGKTSAQPPSIERPLFWHYPHYGNQGGRPGGAIRDGDWKLIQWYDDDKSELFFLKEDVGEAHERSEEYPERVTELVGKLDAWRTSVGAILPKRNPNFQVNKSEDR